MSELLVRTIDKVNETCPYKNAACTKRGDVIAAKLDGWPWGNEERNGEQHRVIVVPDLPLEEAEALLGREYNTDPRNPSRTLQRRAFKLDLDRLVEPITADQVRAAKVRKLPIPDPAVL